MKYDYITEIEKFNPYHDRLGRFSSGGSAASFTIRTKDPKKQYMADMAIAREKERHAAAMANPTNDPDTIAGVKRGQPMTHEQADQGNANPNYGKGYGYSVNCQTCVVAYEARLRGYDVEAKPKEHPTQFRLARACTLAWMHPETGKGVIAKENPPNIRTRKQVTKWLDENTVDGARYTFAHGWKGTNGLSGHIVSLTKEKGKIKIFDPQDGKNHDTDEYLSRIRATYNAGRAGTQGRLRLLRVDDKAIVPGVANDILKGAGQ